MLKRVYKTVTQENGTIKIYGSNRLIQTFYKVPEWNKKEDTEDTEEIEELAFKYRGQIYFVSEFMNIHNKIYNPNPSNWMLEFDGYSNDTYFSGVLIKLCDNGDCVKAFTYVC